MKKNAVLFVLFLFVLPVSGIRAQSGKVLLEEHFQENDRGWNLGETNNVIRKIENGKMILECQKYLTGKGGGYWIKLPDFKLPPTSYSITYNTKWIKNVKEEGKYNPYGVILGDYYFLSYADGDRRLLKYDTVAKKYETIVDWGVQTVINKKGDPNKWEIRYQDGKAAFYANGNMLFKKEITIPEGTSIKLYIENSEMVEFDDIVVKNL
ncbi:MAG: hypothetical protein K0Q79_2610 [Flavipsychrobacter sp.]|jgi:hypothetical protein|nr:hypothetical protein [Flavipsychrobacter sp.]